MGSTSIGENLEKIRNLLDIEAPQGNDEIVANNEDVLRHNLYGIHIKKKNNALSDTNPHICIGWSELGDIALATSKEEIASIYELHFQKNNHGKGQDIGQIWRFIHDMKVGDYVIFADNSVFHIGKVKSDCYYDDNLSYDQDSDYKYKRKVKWVMTNINRKILSENLHNSLKTAMSIFRINDYKSAVVDILNGNYQKDEYVEMIGDFNLNFETSIEVPFEQNRIIFGAPGTGKSHLLKKDCIRVQHAYEGTEVERVTFHPDYTYSQFVGTYKPVMDMNDEKIRYEYVPGPFMRILAASLKNAKSNSEQPYILLIEEINRAKVASVFGDVFQLLDRNDSGVSEYEIHTSEDIRRYLVKELGGDSKNYKKIRIPNNMFIWATMNSADQGVFPMDTAFKRRWNFEYLGINDNQKELDGVGKFNLKGCDELVEWNLFRKAINDKMGSNEFKINEDKLIGPFFLAKKIFASNENGTITNAEKFIEVFKGKVIMYLYEDAVKQGKHRFFEGCDSSKYSTVCEAFDKMGMGIFGSSFKETYYDKQRNSV